MENTTINNTVPIDRKVTLTIREAAESSNIGMNKTDSLLCPPIVHLFCLSGQKADKAEGI